MQPSIAGHRGAGGLAPENTLAGFLKAVELGVRLIELDVRLTRDGVLVCFHDDRLDRLTPERGPVAEWDWEPLSQVAVLRGTFRGAFPDARIPRLEDVFPALPPDCRFLVEIKPEPERTAEVAGATVETIRAAGAVERCRIISFDPEALRMARDQAPEIPVGVLVGAREGGALLPRARELGAAALHPHFNLVNEELARAAREEGFLLNAWTVNTPEEVRRLAGLGVDEITTDFPDMALGAL